MSVYAWLYKILLVINYYIQARPDYHSGIDELKTILERLYYRLERKYYYDILAPDARYYFINNRNND